MQKGKEIILFRDGVRRVSGRSGWKGRDRPTLLGWLLKNVLKEKTGMWEICGNTKQLINAPKKLYGEEWEGFSTSLDF